MKTLIETKAAPGAIGPYVQAVSVGGMVYTDGQAACGRPCGN